MHHGSRKLKRGKVLLGRNDCVGRGGEDNIERQMGGDVKKMKENMMLKNERKHDVKK